MYHTHYELSMRYKQKKSLHFFARVILGLGVGLTPFPVLAFTWIAPPFHELKYPQTPPVQLQPVQVPNYVRQTPRFQLVSQDQFGNQRIQLYFQDTHTITAPQLWQYISHYRHRYSAIWLYFSHQAPHSHPVHWHTQAAWFAPQIPQVLHQPGFKPVFTYQNLYWKYGK